MTQQPGPALVPVLASLYGDDTWVIAAGLFDDGITIGCHQSRATHRRLMAPDFSCSVRDDARSPYASAGGGGAMELAGGGADRYQFDFTPRPPTEAATIRFDG